MTDATKARQPWDSLSQAAHEWMAELGNFGPTHRGREVKGYMIDGAGDGGKVYWRSADLRAIAAACLEVAAWLDSPRPGDGGGT